MQKVLVTGGSGFFGLFLTKALLRKNYQARVVDIKDLEEPEIKERIEFISADIRDKAAMRRACEGVDYVFHNAAILPISRSSRKYFWEINVGGTKNVLCGALSAKVKKLIFISSSSPYGIPREAPITENTAFNPVCDYGRSKVEAERICRGYREKGLDVVILRPRTVIGEGRLGIFQILYNWVADNKNIYTIGNGGNLYQYLSEGDFTEACMLSLEKYCKNEDFNLGTDRYGTVKEGLQALIDYAKSSSEIVSLPAAPARSILAVLDMLNLVPFTSWHYKTADKPFYFDISKAKKILGWQPKVGNSDMIKNSYDWYISHREEADSAFGTTHRKAAKHKILRILKGLS